MKFATLLASLALALASTHAAECTQDTILAVQSKPEFTTLRSACANLASLSSSTTVDDATKKMCEDKTCVNALDAALKALPDCTVGGVSFKKTYEDQSMTLQTACKNVAASSSASTTMLSATAAATVAVVAVVAQL